MIGSVAQGGYLPKPCVPRAAGKMASPWRSGRRNKYKQNASAGARQQRSWSARCHYLNC